VTQPSDHMRNEGHLDRQRVDPLVVDEAPEPFEAVKQIVLRSGHSALFGGGVGPCELGEAEGALFEDGADQQGEVSRLSRHEKGSGGVDGVHDAVVPWQKSGTSF
jgi:hypothetical protein